MQEVRWSFSGLKMKFLFKYGTLWFADFQLEDEGTNFYVIRWNVGFVKNCILSLEMEDEGLEIASLKMDDGGFEIVCLKMKGPCGLFKKCLDK